MWVALMQQKKEKEFSEERPYPTVPRGKTFPSIVRSPLGRRLWHLHENLSGENQSFMRVNFVLSR